MRLLKFQNENTGIVQRGATTFCFFKIEIFAIRFFFDRSFNIFVNNRYSNAIMLRYSNAIIHKMLKFQSKNIKSQKFHLKKKQNVVAPRRTIPVFSF